MNSEKPEDQKQIFDFKDDLEAIACVAIIQVYLAAKSKKPILSVIKRYTDCEWYNELEVMVRF